MQLTPYSRFPLYSISNQLHGGGNDNEAQFCQTQQSEARISLPSLLCADQTSERLMTWNLGEPMLQRGMRCKYGHQNHHQHVNRCWEEKHQAQENANR